jgi:drug/metabolite transporter (DMT)-like permease
LSTPPKPAHGLPARAAQWRLYWRNQPTAMRGLMYATAAGMVFSVLNALMRLLTAELHPLQSQFLRYFFGLLVLAPWFWRHGFAAYKPQSVGGQFIRGVCHTLGLMLWFAALPKIPLADMTAIGFTGPIFIMLGARIFLGEPMRWERWVAAGIGFTGVLLVVAPKLSGSGDLYHLVMLASAPLFAASFLITKALTRSESTEIILVWQSLTVSLLSLPLALWFWQWPTAWQWAGFVVCGVLGSTGHYFLTKGFSLAEISSTQSLKFLELIWSALMGWLIFSDVPTSSTLIGGAVILSATLWIARRESRLRTAERDAP